MNISPLEYLQNRSWNEKTFTMPKLPRGHEGMILEIIESEGPE